MTQFTQLEHEAPKSRAMLRVCLGVWRGREGNPLPYVDVVKPPTLGELKKKAKEGSKGFEPPSPHTHKKKILLHL